MSSDWRSRIRKPSTEEIETYTTKGRTSEDWRVGARYVPFVDTVEKLPEKEFPGNFLRMRILPALSPISKDVTPSSFCFVVQQLWLKDMAIGHDDVIHMPQTVDPDFEKKCPIAKVRWDIHKEQTKESKEFMKKLFNSPKGFMNVVVRKIELINEAGERVYFTNVGPRVLRIPHTLITYVYRGFKDPEVGDFTDLWAGNDLKYHMERRDTTDDKTGQKKKQPQYGDTKFQEKESVAGTDEEIEYWMTNLHDLTSEYTPLEDVRILDDIAQKIWDKWKGKFGNAAVAGADLNPSSTPSSRSNLRDDERLVEVASQRVGAPATMTSSSADTTVETQVTRAEEQVVEPTGVEIKTSSGATLVVKKSEPGNMPVTSGAPSDDDDDDDNWLQQRINATNERTKKTTTSAE